MLLMSLYTVSMQVETCCHSLRLLIHDLLTHPLSRAIFPHMMHAVQIKSQHSIKWLKEIIIMAASLLQV